MYNVNKIIIIIIAHVNNNHYLCITIITITLITVADMKKYNFDKLEYKSFVSKKLGVRAEFHQVFGIMFLRVTDLNTGIEVRDEFASPREIDYLLKQNGI